MTSWNDTTYSEFGWPGSEDIFAPVTPNARVFADLVQNKIGRVLTSLLNTQVNVGIITSNPDETAPPIAIICEFPTAVSDTILFEAQRLAWNFSRSLLLITVEPHVIRKWSCWETPVATISEYHLDPPSLFNNYLLTNDPEILPRVERDLSTGRYLEEEAVASLSWISLISGSFFREHSEKFQHSHRADRMLLSNLIAVRSILKKQKLPENYCHDILARIIFIQFLFDRKDSSGLAALNRLKLAELYSTRILSNLHQTFADVLEDYEDTYSLFQWLDNRFNGDLFPQPNGGSTSKAVGWEIERDFVKPHHLQTLASFVRGDIDLGKNQRCLWPFYSFDAIPLEFISSIYEEFVNGAEGVAVHYTRAHVVDLMLDRVLPWDSSDWDVKVLDPACGSGIFLVKVYQRLIYRWKYANPDQEITPSVLRSLLDRNLFGVDKDENAIRVASFSLYLAMCDEIDPRFYWSDSSRVHFPRLRNHTLRAADFFEESILGLNSELNKNSYDLVIGNPPWGDTTLTKAANVWATKYSWQVANKDFGVLFLAKSLRLVKNGGLVCLIQSASALLYNSAPTARNLQKQVFLGIGKVENVVNLAAYRWSSVRLFRDVQVPTCIIAVRNVEYDGKEFLYECPKPLHTGEDTYRFLIDNNDAYYIFPEEVIETPWLWSVLMWGGLRDADLIRKLLKFPTIEGMLKRKVVVSRQGIIRGHSRQRLEEKIIGRRLLRGSKFPESDSLVLNTDTLAIASAQDALVHEDDSTDFAAFSLPQLLIKTSWTQNLSSFQARLVETDSSAEGIVCSRSFVSVHAEESLRSFLEAACISYNSVIATYYLFLTSGRFAFDRSEPLIQELRSVPVPPLDASSKGFLRTLANQKINTVAFELFGITKADQILIDDMLEFKLRDFKGKRDFPSYNITNRRNNEEDLRSYSEVMLRVLKSAYGEERDIGIVIYSDRSDLPLSMRLVQIHLDIPNLDGVLIEEISSVQMRRLLINAYQIVSSKGDGNDFYQRHIRTYDVAGEGQSLVVGIVKPDQKRYWLRSAALKDADDITADLFMWSTALQQSETGNGSIT